MATESLVIQIRADGTRVVHRDFLRISQAARLVSRDTDLLQKAFIRLTGAFTAATVVRLADQFTDLQNKLRGIPVSLEQSNLLLERLVQLSNNTRTALAGNVRLFQRLVFATDSTTESFEDLLGITETFGKALVLSGATASEAQGGMIQFSQGLAFGSLRAEELRTVLEQLPEVTKILQKELGVTRGGLQVLADEGKVTTEVMVRSFKSVREEIDKRFANTIPTIGQAFTVLQNSFIAFLGDVNRGTGIFSALAKIIIDVAKNMEFWGRVAIAGALIPALVSLNAVLNTTVFISKILRASFLGGIALLISFSDQIRIAKDSSVTLADFAVGAFRGLIDELSNLAPGIEEVAKQLGLVEENFKFEDITFKQIATNFAITMDAILGTAKGTIAALIIIFEGLPKLVDAAIRDVGVAVAEPIEKRIADAQKRLQDAITTFGPVLPPSVQASLNQEFDAIARARKDALTPDKSEISKTFSEIGTAAGIAFENALQSTDITSRILDKAFAGGQNRAEARLAEEAATANADLNAERQKGKDLLTAADIELGRVNERLNKEADFLRKGSDERKALQQVLRIEESLKRRNVDLTDKQVQAEIALAKEKILSNIVAERQADILNRYNEEVGLQQEALDVLLPRIEKTVEGYARFGKSVDRTQLFMRDFNVFLKTELATGLKQTLDQLTDLSGFVSGALVGSLDQASDALFEFARSGFKDVESLKEAFSNLFADLGKDITRFIIRLIVLKTLEKALGGGVSGNAFDTGTLGTAPGSLGSNVSGPFALQAGGFLGRGQPAIVGERGPELFVPTDSGRVVPNSQLNNRPQVIVTPVIVDDPDEVANFLATEAGADSVVSVIQRRRHQLRGIGR